MIKKIRIKPLEPLMLRGQGEFEPLVTGSHVSAQSLIIPRPSTIAGLLGYLKFTGSYYGDWLETLHSLNVKIYGTLIEEGNGNTFYPLRMGNLFALVDWETLSSLSKTLEKITGSDYDKWEKEIYDIFYEKNKFFELVNFQDRIGISLDRQRKVVEEHYLYTARYLSFKKEISYIVFVDGDLGLKERIVNFGGEGRIAKLEVEDSNSVFNKNSSNYYLALSPILIPDDAIDILLEEDLIVMGKVDKVSLGFDIAHNRRKEMLTAVLEGSIIKGEFVNRYKEVVKNRSLFEKYEEIGYNTICGISSQNNVRKILLDS